MAHTDDIAAWIALFIGLYSLAAAVGELRRPGTWGVMLTNFARGPGLRFLMGFVVLAFGAAIYLVNPWRPDDWLSLLISVMGGLMVAEGVLFLAAGDRLLPFARVFIGRAARFWAGFSALIGIALIVVALARL